MYLKKVRYPLCHIFTSLSKHCFCFNLKVALVVIDSGNGVGDESVPVYVLQFVCRRSDSTSYPGDLYPGTVSGRPGTRSTVRRDPHLRVSRARPQE